MCLFSFRLGEVRFCNKGGKPAAEGTFRLCFWGDVCFATTTQRHASCERIGQAFYLGVSGCCSVCCPAGMQSQRHENQHLEACL